MSKRKALTVPDVPDFDFGCLSSVPLPVSKPAKPKKKKRKKIEMPTLDTFFPVIKPEKKESVVVTPPTVRAPMVTPPTVTKPEVIKPLVMEVPKRVLSLTALEHAKACQHIFHMSEINELTSFIEQQEQAYEDTLLYKDLRLVIVHGPSSCGKSWCVEHVSKQYEFEVLDLYDNDSKDEDASSLQDIVRDSLCIPSDEAMFSDDSDVHSMRIVCVEDVDTLEDYRMQSLIKSFKLSHKDLWPITPKEKRAKPEDLRRPTNVLILTATNMFTHSMGLLKSELFLPRKRSAYKEITIQPLTPNQCKTLCHYVCEQMDLEYNPELVDLYYENPSHLLRQLEMSLSTGTKQGHLDEVKGSGNQFDLMKKIFNPESGTSIEKYEGYWNKVSDSLYAHVWNNYLQQGPKILNDCLEHMTGMADLFAETLGVTHSDTDFMIMLGTKVYHTDLMKKANTYVPLNRQEVTWHDPNTLVKWGSGRKGEKIRGTGICNLSTRNDWEIARSVSTMHRLHQEKKMKDVTNYKQDPRYNLRHHLGSYHTLKSTKVFHKVKEVFKLRKFKKGKNSLYILSDIVWCYLPWEDRYTERNEYELDDDFQKSSSKKASKKRSVIKDAEREVVKNHVLTNAFKLLSTELDYNKKKPIRKKK